MSELNKKDFNVKRILNWKPDPPDPRDFIFRDHFEVKSSRAKRFLTVSLKRRMSEVEDQGYLGSCTANAFAGNLEYLWLLKEDPFQASRLFIYYNERAYINEIYVDGGAYIRDGIKTLVAHGVCSETTVPYIEKDFSKKPSDEAYTEALARRISTYYRLTDMDSLKQCLSDRFPFVFGTTLFESFESERTETRGTVSMPKPGEQELGGHAMLCVGYNDNTQRFVVRNSWGSDWGSKGYCTIPYEYMMRFARDFWTVRA